MLAVLLLNRDIVIEIVFHLSPKDIIRLRCTCKSWNDLLSSPEFLVAHHQQSKIGLPGHIVQFYCSHFRAFFKKNFYYSTDMAYFSCGIFNNKFFHDRIILTTSNGILCCREHRIIYNGDMFIGSPAYPSCIQIKAEGPMNCNNSVLAFDPFGCSSNGNSPSFKLASIYKSDLKGCNQAASYYNFTIYSSRTGRWKRSKEVCFCNYPIQAYQQVFTNGKFYWLTSHVVISFDDEEQRSDLILLPPISSDERCGGGHCLGESQGYLHYVCCRNLEVRVWLLGGKNEWIDKYHLRLSESIAREAFRRRPDSLWTWETYFACNDIKKFPKVVCFRNDVLLILLERYSALISYDLRTGKYHFSMCGIGGHQFPPLPTLIPYSFSFAAVKALKQLIQMPGPPFALVPCDSSFRKSRGVDEKRKRDDDVVQ